MEVNLKGKINNIPDFKDRALDPVFEAIINSIQSIQERGNGRGKITVIINRDSSQIVPIFNNEGEFKFHSNAKKDKLPEILDFIIEDDGIGFTKENFNSFNISDSIYKEHLGCKGIGRFSWLKAFEKVEIESVYEENGQRKLRRFDFSIHSEREIFERFHENTDSNILTTVKLLTFKKGYRENESAYKTTEKIAQRILEHLLSYYINNTVPEIIVKDDKKEFQLDNIYKEIENTIVPETIELLGHEFTIFHVELPHTRKSLHQIVYCADGRDVTSTNINNLLGTSSISRNNRKIYYAAYIIGDYLSNHVDSLRRGFNFPKEDYQLIDNNYEISKETLEKSILNQIRLHLSEYLDELNQKKKTLVDTVILENPILANIPSNHPEIYDEIKPNDTEKQILELLYKKKGLDNFQTQFEYKELLKTQFDSYEEIKEKCEEIYNKIGQNEKNNLAEYMVWRNCVINLLESKIQSDQLDKYQKEKIIHDIIFPRKATSNDISIDNINLWLIDDQLIFHEFATSDKPLKEIFETDSDFRPDVIIFSNGDTNQNLDEISIFELKRPMLKKEPKDPISYMYDIIEEIKEKNKKWFTLGRPLYSDERTRFHCYVLCDIIQDIEKIKRNHMMIQLNNNLGYYKYHTELKAHVWILSFDEILKVAKRRNSVFLSKLQIKS